ncbi:MAG: Mur ligase family protein [Nitrososphaerota archaeon]|nr:Mur ligase family protein [Nitrososphaerota archaeon]
MSGLRHCNALIVDMTHGGQVLCRELLKRKCVVHCLDNHRTLSEDSVKELKSIGAEVYRTEIEVPALSNFDVVIVQHADPKLKIFSEALEDGVPIITHARAVGIILSEEKGSTKIIEVTGTNGKTTVCNMLAKVASNHGFNTLVHDSISTRLLGGENKVLAEGFSITPANILRAWRLAEEQGVRPDLCIFEVSLGGTGAADIGVVTGIYDNYRVSFMVNAFNSKLQMAVNMSGGGVLVLNGDNPPTRKFIHVFRGPCNVYGLENGLQVKGRPSSYDVNEGTAIEGDVVGLSTISLKKLDCRFSFKLKPQVFGRYQALNALAALTAMLSLEISIDEVCRSLSEFGGVDGRSKASVEDWGLIVECRNRGMNIPAMTLALSEAVGLKKLRLIKRVIAIVGGSERAACEIIDVNRLAAELKMMEGVDLYVLYGALGVRLSEMGVKGQVFKTLEESMLYAKSEVLSTPGSMILVCSNEA